MAHLQYLVFNNENIPMSASYSMSLSDMYIDGFKSRLAADTSYGGLWDVSFTLKEF